MTHVWNETNTRLSTLIILYKKLQIQHKWIKHQKTQILKSLKEICIYWPVLELEKKVTNTILINIKQNKSLSHVVGKIYKPIPQAFFSSLQYSSIYHTVITNIFNYSLLICKNFIVNKVILHLSNITNSLFEKYPFLYKFIDIIFTIKNKFNLYIMNLIFKLHNILEKDYPVMYYVVICMYREYQLIIMGGGGGGGVK